jgi:hypothetical protein
LRTTGDARTIVRMTPVATPSELNTSPEVVLPIVLVAVLLVLLAIPIGRALIAAVDQVVELSRTYGPVAAGKALDKRPGLAQTPWFCLRCTSRNGVAARVCYKCGGSREEFELLVPDAEAPAGPSAGLATRSVNRTGSGTTSGTRINPE